MSWYFLRKYRVDILSLFPFCLISRIFCFVLWPLDFHSWEFSCKNAVLNVPEENLFKVYDHFNRCFNRRFNHFDRFSPVLPKKIYQKSHSLNVTNGRNGFPTSDTTIWSQNFGKRNVALCLFLNAQGIVRILDSAGTAQRTRQHQLVLVVHQEKLHIGETKVFSKASSARQHHHFRSHSSFISRN